MIIHSVQAVRNPHPTCVKCPVKLPLGTSPLEIKLGLTRPSQFMKYLQLCKLGMEDENTFGIIFIIICVIIYNMFKQCPVT